MDALKYVFTLLVVAFLALGTNAQVLGQLGTGLQGGRQIDINLVYFGLNNCVFRGAIPCYGTFPVRCYTARQRCDDRQFCPGNDDEAGCDNQNAVETRSFTVTQTSTATADQATTSTVSTTTTTTTSSSSLTTSTSLSLVTRTSTVSSTPNVFVGSSFVTTSVTSDAIVLATSAFLPPAGNFPGPGSACTNYGAAGAAVPMAAAGIFTISNGNFIFTGALVATASCRETIVSV